MRSRVIRKTGWYLPDLRNPGAVILKFVRNVEHTLSGNPAWLTVFVCYVHA